MHPVLIMLASAVLFLWLGLSGTEAAFSPARLAQPEGLVTQAQYYPGWRWHAYHPGVGGMLTLDGVGVIGSRRLLLRIQQIAYSNYTQLGA